MNVVKWLQKKKKEQEQAEIIQELRQRRYSCDAAYVNVNIPELEDTAKGEKRRKSSLKNSIVEGLEKLRRRSNSGKTKYEESSDKFQPLIEGYPKPCIKNVRRHSVALGGVISEYSQVKDFETFKTSRICYHGAEVVI